MLHHGVVMIYHWLEAITIITTVLTDIGLLYEIMLINMHMCYQYANVYDT